MTSGRPSAKDVPEDVILRVLRERPGVWHTHFDPDPTRAVQIMPTLAAFPLKVLVAKLNSMAKRGLINGGGTVDCRGDWHVD